MQKIQPSQNWILAEFHRYRGIRKLYFNREWRGPRQLVLKALLSGPYFRLALLAGSLEDRATGKKGCSTGRQPHFESTPDAAHLIT
jgi:hypothetical protein